MQPQQQEILVNVILDGHINDKNLKQTGTNRQWLDKQLHEQGYHSAEEVFLGAVNTADHTIQF